ncbi:YTH family protein [Clavispora lusitaniae]|uniref:YTH domain-containing protein n=1 Tax=Clavispora lusitaniae (strain ATCC 42720) TaxID=306902 RepID=C4Y9B7_CLAL4|nr:uncharacterized protein CLUG_04795 [Clavispora lusitaniae ATCC 42720]EEQ40667.1 hypothetical protein CLUG_04795 [Clavispora lusitaniae ATCC 42720]KAF5209413.1 hypothetical protein E0198_003713 [Clavispora lusitaniae]KAF7581421.1 YTH family protein [Clavispora lusitaniae]
MFWPLFDSQLIGFKAPDHNPSIIKCTKSTLQTLYAITYFSYETDIIDIACTPNIWSNSFINTNAYCEFDSDPTPGLVPYIYSQDSCDSIMSSPMQQALTTDLSSPDSGFGEDVTSKSSSDTFSLCDMNHNILQVGPNARFFVIKSYSPLDVEAALKHCVWTSTELGNKKLAKAFEETSDGIFLFYSVNGSSRFCGVAQMQAQIDYTKETDIWVESTRWKGIFPVQWHFVIDIPNKFFRLLRVPANENKPVTNSRDTQELPHEVGVAMLNIFSGFHSQKQSS